MTQEMRPTRACGSSPKATGREPAAAIHAPASARDTVGSASDERQGKPSVASRRDQKRPSCRRRASRGARKLRRPAREPGWSADSSFHDTEETRHE
jgi:hypothetical protein